jgi:hypothetical protein
MEVFSYPLTEAIVNMINDQKKTAERDQHVRLYISTQEVNGNTAYL